LHGTDLIDYNLGLDFGPDPQVRVAQVLWTRGPEVCGEIDPLVTLEHEMAAEIKPGQWVNVTVKAELRSEAKKKTLIRVCEKNPEVRTERARLSRSRKVRWDRRGGRLWPDRPARLAVVKTTPGSSYKVFASIDVLRDLNSLGSAVEVTPA
jgi:hypothetical protein